MVDEAYRVVRIGLEVLNLAKEEKRSHPSNQLLQQMQLNIGVHTGTAYGSVIGTGLLRYDVFGPDVSLAKEVNARSTAWQCTISKKTKDLLE